MKIKINEKITELERRKIRLRKNYFVIALTFALITAFAPLALAEGTDPLAAINNLSDFVFSAIKAIGIILLGWGVVQIGMAGNRAPPPRSRRPAATGHCREPPPP